MNGKDPFGYQLLSGAYPSHHPLFSPELPFPAQNPSSVVGPMPSGGATVSARSGH
jgi:hypothetical protein